MTESITPEAAEKYVRERWEKIRWTSFDVGPHDGTRLLIGPYDCHVLNQVGNVELYLTPEVSAKIWLSAYEYTKAHERKIKEKRQEIGWIQEVAPNYEIDRFISKRILAILEAQLAELMRGWRQG